MYRRDYSTFSMPEFRNDVSIQNWDMSTQNSNTLMSDFIFKVQGCVESHAPSRKLKFNEIKSKPWISPYIVTMIRQSDNLFKRRKKHLSNKNIKMLNNKFRNRVNRELGKSKKSYFSSYFNEHCKNIKKTWEGIRSLVNVKNCDS